MSADNPYVAVIAMDEVVGSSQIEAIGYDAPTATLAIQFKGGSVYHYFDVEPTLYEEFQASLSKGIFFGQRIKSAYAYMRLPHSSGPT